MWGDVNDDNYNKFKWVNDMFSMPKIGSTPCVQDIIIFWFSLARNSHFQFKLVEVYISWKKWNEKGIKTVNVPSWNQGWFCVRLDWNRLTSSGVIFLNGWFKATICMEKPNTKIASTAKNLAKSFIRSPMMIAHGPNRWWNDRKSKICTHASRNDRAKNWLRQ